jgi:hypothetical protein
MKRKISFLIALLIFIGSYNKSSARDGAYSYGDTYLSVGASFGYFNYYGKYASASVPVVLTAEYGLKKYISLGGFLGIQSYTYEDFYHDGLPPYTKVYYSYNCSAVSLGLKGSFHVFPYINDRYDARVDDSNMDAYITAVLGSSFHSYREVTSTGYADYSRRASRLVFGPSLGFRYMVTPRVGAFVELGVGAFGLSTAGVVFDL